MLPSALEIVNWSSNEFNANNSEPNFISASLAWGLSYFLISSEDGRRVIQEIIEQQGDPIKIVNTVYPGGRPALEKNWQQFIANLPKKLVRYPDA